MRQFSIILIHIRINFSDLLHHFRCNNVKNSYNYQILNYLVIIGL